MSQELRSWSQVSLSSQACHSFKVFQSKPGFSHSTSSSSWEINPQKKLAWGKYEGLQIQSSESCRVMLILNRFHCCPMPEILQQVEVQPIHQKGPEVVIFQLVKQRFYFCSNFACHVSAQRQFFGGRQYVTPVTKDLKGNTPMLLITLLLADVLQQHTQEDRNWRIQSWIQSRRRCESFN